MPNKQWGKEEGAKINGGKGIEDFSNKPGGIGISKNPLISVMNEKRDKCLVWMLNLKVNEKEVKLVKTR